MLSDIPIQLWPIEKVLQSTVGFVPSKMTREGALMEILQNLHPEAGRYVKLVYGPVWECGNTADEVLHYAEWGIWIDDNFSIFHTLLIQSLALRFFLLGFPHSLDGNGKIFWWSRGGSHDSSTER